MKPLTVLCIASYEKGAEFMRECKRQGCRVILITSLSLKDSASFPRESLDEIYYMPDNDKVWDHNATIFAVSHLARTENLGRIVPLDDFDLEKAAALREHLRIPGMGESTTRYFRDKLAMRMRAQEAGVPVPAFVHLLNDERVREFTERISPPWILKPRSSAGAIGIKRVGSYAELRSIDDGLGDQRSFYLLEEFIPGDVFHVDSIVYENEVLFASASGYGRPPLEVSHGGGIFTTRLLERGSEIERGLVALNARVMDAMGLLRGVSHTEFIRGEDGRLYFLETSARVGGANIAELVEAASGVNLWAEWAKIEVAPKGGDYSVSPAKKDYAGLLVSLARQEEPDHSVFNDPEVVWRMRRKHHVGVIVASPDQARIGELLDRYVERVRSDFHASAPPKERPSE